MSEKVKVLDLKEFTKELGQMIDASIQSHSKEMGLDRVDRKFGAFPGIADPVTKDGKKDRVHTFFKGLLTVPELRTPEEQGVMREQMLKAQKAMMVGDSTASLGEYLIPEEFRAELIRDVADLSELRPYVNVKKVNSRAGTTPAISTDLSVSWDDEGEVTESEPTFTEKTFTIHNMKCLSKMSRELVADSGVNLVAEMRTLFAEAVMEEEDKMIAIGDGSTQPQGIFSATWGASYNINGALTFETLVRTQYALPARYRKRKPRWVMNDSNQKNVRLLEDSQGRPIWESAKAGQPESLLGAPISYQNDAPDAQIAYVALGFYYWYDREAMTIEQTITGGTAFDTHALHMKLVERVDGKIVVANSVAVGYGIS